MTIYFSKTTSDKDRSFAHQSYQASEGDPAILPASRWSYRGAGKLLLDYVLVLLSLPVALPLIGLLALLVALDGGSPFYWQRRLGRNGAVFHMLKLRTMVLGADEVLIRYLASNPEARREWNDKQKLSKDPRITWIGQILRKTSLDELPQFWNVFRGQMSLVGPRPMMFEQKDLYPGLAYFRMRPGITGRWQISDRNKCSFAERAVFDAVYYRDISLKADIYILFRTVGVVFRGTGC